MENWIGIGIWIVMGAAIGLVMKAAIKRPEETPGHTPIIMVLGAFGAVIGGMLGVGIFHLYEPLALSAGGMGGALALSLLCAFLYRWGVRSMV
jgi:hypothetical protein